MEQRSLSNCQLIMIAEIEAVIKPLKAGGKDYAEIRSVVQENFKDTHWLVPDPRQKNECIATALMLYAMDDKQREAVLKLKELTGYIIV